MAISSRRSRRLELRSSSSMTDNLDEKEHPSPNPHPSSDMDDEDIDNVNSSEAEDTRPPVEEKKLTPEEEEAKKKRDAELREKYKDWPLKNIKEPHENDVMYGRGGGTNHHPGNKRYRKNVEDRKVEYVNCKRLDKPLVALEIIREWRSQIPPGRFLKLDEKTGLWNDVGDKKAREKTSQALREKAPMIKKQLGEDEDDDDDDDTAEDPKAGSKATRFAEGTKDEDAKQPNKPVLARDHSLGREYIEAGQAVSLDGFSWQDPFQSKQRETSYGRPAPTNGSYPAGRNSSHGSLGMAPPHHHVSVGAPPPPPHDYWGHSRQRDFSSGRIESWGSASYGDYYVPPPPPPPPPGDVMHQRSGSWSQQHGPPPHPGMFAHRRSGSWGSSGREHSLGMFPLIGASVAGAADQGIFDSGNSWANRAAPPLPPPASYDYGGPIPSTGSLGPYRQPPSPTNSTPSPKPYNVDLTIAKTWSGNQDTPIQVLYDEMPPPPPSVATSPMRDLAGRMGTVPKPQIVKRDTSHQNESSETKPSIKRAALNRDNSLASNRLKQEYMPEYFNNDQFDAEREVRRLSTNFEMSSIDAARPKPKPLGPGNRVTTMELIAKDLMAKPIAFSKDSRVSTIDALELSLGVDGVGDADQSAIAGENLPKPKSLETADRLTTSEFSDLLNSPMGGVDEDADNRRTSSASVLSLGLTRDIQYSDDWLGEE